MRTREERQADRQDRREERRDSRNQAPISGAAKGEAIGAGVGLALAPLTFGLSVPAGAVIGATAGGISENRQNKRNRNAMSTMQLHSDIKKAEELNLLPSQNTPPPVPETSVVDPRQQELYRQAREVVSGNVNAAQAEYFRQQNEGLFDIKERKGAKNTLNPVSNRSDGMTDVYSDLYGSEESRGF